MEITLPKDKVKKLISLLNEWPSTRTTATLQEVWNYKALYTLQPSALGLDATLFGD
jgi:hypothetical protein